MFYLNLEVMEKVCHRYAVALFDTDNQPISPFSLHTRQLLDSALNTPRQTYSGKELYPTLIDKATILFYSLNKNHAFPNGNKRIATASLLIFLYINEHWISADPKSLAELALEVANSKNMDSAIAQIKFWLSEKLIKYVK